MARSTTRTSGWSPQPIKSPGLRARFVAFYSRGFEDVQATVAFVRRRVLIADGGERS